MKNAIVGRISLENINNMLHVLLSIIIIITTFNAVMLIAACFEYASSFPRNSIIPQRQTNDNPDHKQTVIMLHGFGGSPDDFRNLKDKLIAENYHVITPAIPFQNKNYFAFLRGQFSTEDYINWAQDLVEKNHRETGKAPIVIGFSMGGTLSIISSEKTPIKKLILIAPYLDLTLAPFQSDTITVLMKWLTPVIPKISKGQIFSKEGYKAYRPGSYLVSISAFHALEDIKKKSRELFNTLEMPILMIASVKDRVACYKAATRLGHPMENCKIITTEESNHILMYDHDAELITESILNFLNED